MHRDPLAFSAVWAQPTRLAPLALNMIGAVIYVILASRAWAIPEEKGLNSMTGEPFVWAFAVLPIFAIFLALNLTWGILILSRRLWHNGRSWLLALAIWIIAIAIDFAHH